MGWALCFFGLVQTSASRSRSKNLKSLIVIHVNARLFYFKIAFVITDGQQTTDKGPYIPLDAATEGLKSQGITIYSMGIGKQVNVAELAALASGYENVFLAKSFKALEGEVEGIKQEICEGIFT